MRAVNGKLIIQLEWPNDGIKVGSITMIKLSNFKIFENC